MARKPLSPLDAAWLHMEAPANPMVITAVLWFRRPLPLDALKEVLEARLLAPYPRFRQRVVETARGPCWEPDPAFHLDRHLHHVGLPEPGGRPALQDLVSDRMSTPLDLTMAPWQFHLVDGYQGGSALICRIHHCVADGIRLARLLLQMTDDRPPLPPPGQRRSWLHTISHPDEAVRLGIDQAKAAAREGVDLLRHPQRLSKAVGWGAEAALEAERLLLLPADPPSALRRPLTVRKVAAWSPPIRLAAVKRLGHRTGTTVNDVLVTALAAALHDHLDAAHTPVDQVRAFVPVNLRPLDEPVPRELGNHFSLVVLPLPVGELPPLDRLQGVHAEMGSLKAGSQAAVVWALLHIMGSSPAPVERVIVDLMGKKGSLIVTNVPGPREELRLAGVPVGGVMVWVPQSGDVGLGVSILSYDGEVTVGVCGDAEVLGDPEELVARFLAAFEALELAAGDL